MNIRLAFLVGLLSCATPLVAGNPSETETIKAGPAPSAPKRTRAPAKPLTPSAPAPSSPVAHQEVDRPAPPRDHPSSAQAQSARPPGDAEPSHPAHETHPDAATASARHDSDHRSPNPAHHDRDDQEQAQAPAPPPDDSTQTAATSSDDSCSCASDDSDDSRHLGPNRHHPAPLHHGRLDRHPAAPRPPSLPDGVFLNVGEKGRPRSRLDKPPPPRHKAAWTRCRRFLPTPGPFPATTKSGPSPATSRSWLASPLSSPSSSGWPSATTPRSSPPTPAKPSISTSRSTSTPFFASLSSLSSSASAPGTHRPGLRHSRHRRGGQGLQRRTLPLSSQHPHFSLGPVQISRLPRPPAAPRPKT